MPLYSEYVLVDRTTAGKVGLKVDDSQLFHETSTGPASPEPIVEDKINQGTYWKVYVDDGQIGNETTAIVQDDQVVLQDQTTSDIWEIQVHDGILYMENDGILVRIGFAVLIRRRRR